jgi:hypothetical protein
MLDDLEGDRDIIAQSDDEPIRAGKVPAPSMTWLGSRRQ